MTLNEAFRLVRDVPDFPKKGILFKDLTPLLAHPQAFKVMALALLKEVAPDVTHLIAIESRGFILGAAMAQHRDNLGVVLVRKPGKLPGELFTQTYELEYGTDSLQIQKGLVPAGSKVVIIDDVLATGGTAQAVEKLCQSCDYQVEKSLFLMEIAFLEGRNKLSRPYKSLKQI